MNTSTTKQRSGTAKWIIGIIVIVLVVWGFSYSDREANNEEIFQDPIKIGIIAPLTGKGASRGESTIQGLELALKKIEAEGLFPEGGIELIYQDVAIDKAKDALGAFNLLTDIEKVVAIIGPLGSNVALSITSLVDEKQVPTILHAVSAREATENNDYVFRLWPTGARYAEKMLSRIETLGYERIAALSATTDNTIDLLNVFKEEISFSADEQVAVDVKDFRTQLTKIKEANPDALFINLFVGQIGVAAKQAREIGIDVPIFTNSVASAVELEVGPQYLEGAWFPVFAGYTNDVRGEFVELFGAEPSAPDNASAAHDALFVLAEAIHSVGTDGEDIKNFLYETTFNGSIGEFQFRENGDAVVPLKFNVVKDGEIVDLEL